MLNIFVKTHFSAGHHLRNYPGNCEKPHGHNWNVEVMVKATKLDNLGMGIDFRTVKNALATVMDDLDHCNLNEHPEFVSQNPSSENIAIYIFKQLKEPLTSENYYLYSISVGETENTRVTYMDE
jgi:6-pyruvoyltetrahydropterin/6-carboxytetrahydropterin synthase